MSLEAKGPVLTGPLLFYHRLRLCLGPLVRAGGSHAVVSQPAIVLKNPQVLAALGDMPFDGLGMAIGKGHRAGTVVIVTRR